MGEFIELTKHSLDKDLNPELSHGTKILVRVNTISIIHTVFYKSNTKISSTMPKEEIQPIPATILVTENGGISVQESYCEVLKLLKVTTHSIKQQTNKPDSIPMFG